VKKVKDVISADHVDEAIEQAAGCCHALALRMLHEFSKDGGDGVIEIRFRQGKSLGVYIRAISKDETRKPANVRGKIASWELTPEQIAGVIQPLNEKYARLAAMSTMELMNIVEGKGGEMNLAMASTLHDRFSNRGDIAPQVVCDAQGLEQGSTWLACTEARIYG
jgi:hypothetical protein